MEVSPLGRCPPEIRNRIYELVLVQPHGISINPYDPHHRVGDDRHLPAYMLNAGTLALSQTCKQVYEESIGIFCSLNTFLMTDWVCEECYEMSVSEYQNECTKVFDCFTRRIRTQNVHYLRHITVVSEDFDLEFPDALFPTQILLGWTLGLSCQDTMVACHFEVHFVIKTSGHHRSTRKLDFRDGARFRASSESCQREATELATEFHGPDWDAEEIKEELSPFKDMLDTIAEAFK